MILRVCRGKGLGSRRGRNGNWRYEVGEGQRERVLGKTTSLGGRRHLWDELET